MAISCGLLGCYLVLRKMAMVGDAISHSVLPGIIIAYMIAGTRDSPLILIGAGLLGIFTTFLIEFFHRKGKLQTDASIGVTFTWLFALGVILVTAFAGQVDIDQDCVLHGQIAFVPLDAIELFGGAAEWPRTVVVMAIVLAVIIAFIALGYRPLFLTTFDPAYATAIGVATGLWHYLLMGAVSLTTVAAFDAVGAILVVALLVAPPATAYLLTHKFLHMLLITAGLGIIIAIGGYYLATAINGEIAGAMSVVAGILFAIAFLCAPNQGVLWRGRGKAAAEISQYPTSA